MELNGDLIAAVWEENRQFFPKGIRRKRTPQEEAAA
jgi:hypothetical protein